MSTIDAKALRQISAEAGSPTASGGDDTDQLVDGDETGSLRSKTDVTLASNDVDRKALVRQRWLNAINKVREQVSQVGQTICILCRSAAYSAAYQTYEFRS